MDIVGFTLPDVSCIGEFKLFTYVNGHMLKSEYVAIALYDHNEHIWLYMYMQR